MERVLGVLEFIPIPVVCTVTILFAGCIVLVVRHFLQTPKRVKKGAVHEGLS